MGRVRSVFTGVVHHPAGQRRYAIFLSLFALILVVVNLASWRIHAAARRTLELELGERLTAIATAAAQAIDPGYVTEIEAAPEDALADLIVRDQFERLRTSLNVANLVLLDPEGRTLVDLSRVSEPGTVNPVSSLHLESFTIARTGMPATSELYTSLGSYYMNGYAPVLDLDGSSVVAVVGVEAGATFFDALDTIRRIVLVVSLASAAAIVLLAAIFFRILRMQSQLDETLRRTETLSLMGEMAASVAHEIKNPLGIIRATAERLRKRHGTGEEIFDYIPEEVDRLDAILGAYLDFARRGGGVTGSDCDPGEVADAVLRLTRRDLETTDIAIEIDIAPGLRAAIDAGGLQQALLNLILNARQAMPEGGTLTIRILSERGGVVLQVTDTGTGIAPEDRTRVFEPFYSGRERGSGLGLAITQRVIREAGGTIDFESAPGRGTTFTIRIPAVDTHRQRPGGETA